MGISKKIGIGIVFIFLILILGSIAAKKSMRKETLHRQASGWYAVHLVNGHVYFGHLAKVTPDTLMLSDTRLLEEYTAQTKPTASSTSFQVQSVPQQVYQLVRRGETNNMTTDNVLFIDRHAVLFWEKLSADAKMTEWLESMNSVQ